MFNIESKAIKILAKSSKIKSTFAKMKDDLLKVNQDLMDEAAVISNKINELQSTQKDLSSESLVNGKVIKNIEKILGE